MCACVTCSPPLCVSAVNITTTYSCCGAHTLLHCKPCNECHASNHPVTLCLAYSLSRVQYIVLCVCSKLESGILRGNHSVDFRGEFKLYHKHAHSLAHACRVVIRGEQGENAVLCTEGATYDLRAADTSNALLLVPSLSYTQDNCKRTPCR